MWSGGTGAFSKLQLGGSNLQPGLTAENSKAEKLSLPELEARVCHLADV